MLPVESRKARCPLGLVMCLAVGGQGVRCAASRGSEFRVEGTWERLSVPGIPVVVILRIV